VVTHHLQVKRRTGKVRQSETDILPLCYATNPYHLYTDDLMWQNFLCPQCRNCSRDPDHAHLGNTHITRLRLRRVGLAMVSQCTKFEVSRFARCKAMNGSAKYRKWGGFWWLGGTQGHGQFDRAHTTSYLTLIVTVCLSCSVFEI